MTALASGSSSAAALLNPVNPSIATISIFSRQVSGCEASQVLKTCLERPRIHDQEPAGTATVSYRSQVQNDGDVPVPIRGVSLHVFIHADGAHVFKPSWIIDQQTLAFTQDSGVGGSSRTHPGPGRRAPPSNDERPRPSVPSALPSVRAWRAAGPLGSCLGATRERTPGTGSGARSRATWWGATRKARARGA